MSNQQYPPDPRVQGYQQPPNQVPYEERGAGAADDTVKTSNSGAAYSQSQHERYVDPMGNQVENRAEVYEDENQRRANIRFWIANVTYFVLAVLEILLLLRFLFRLLGANQGNSLVMFLYNLSYVFAAPFKGIFADHAVGGNGVFEVSTLIAMVVYALLAWGIVSLGRVIFAPTLSGRQSSTTSRRRRYS